jgi:guanylate kinase
VLPPNFEELKKRLLFRNTDSEEVINKRLEISKNEIEEIAISDFFHEKIVNDDLTVSYEIFKKNICNMYPTLKN